MNWLDWLKVALNVVEVVAILGFVFSLGALYALREVRREIDAKAREAER